MLRGPALLLDYLNAYVPILQSSEQVLAFMTQHLGLPIPSPALSGKIGLRPPRLDRLQTGAAYSWRQDRAPAGPFALPPEMVARHYEGVAARVWVTPERQIPAATAGVSAHCDTDAAINQAAAAGAPYLHHPTLSGAPCLARNRRQGRPGAV